MIFARHCATICGERTVREKIEEYILSKYETSPEFLWKRFPGFEVFRHKVGRKWFAIIMDVEYTKLGIRKSGRVDILNLKLDGILVDILKKQTGFLPAYHMQKEKWISVLLDGTVELNTIFQFLDMSFENTIR